MAAGGAGVVWALIDFVAAFFSTSKTRRMPSWQAVARSLPSGDQATASTRLGCWKLRVGTLAATFHWRTVLSAEPEYSSPLSVNEAASAASPWENCWTTLPKSSGIGWPGWNPAL